MRLIERSAPAPAEPGSQAWPEDIQTWKVASSSGGGHYTVRLMSDGRMVCDCPDFQYRGTSPGYRCKHIDQVRPAA